MKSRDEVLRDILTRLEKEVEINSDGATVTFSTEAGSITRTFSEVVSEEFNNMYSELDLISRMGFLSTSKGIFLDMIGELVSCSRYVNETDENYRTRISKQSQVLSGANEVAIREKAMAVAGVKDVILTQFVKGPGSFAAYIIADDPRTPDSIIANVRDMLEYTKGYGIRVEVRRPVLIPVELMVNVFFKEGLSDSEKASIRESIRRNLKDYADNVELGGTFVISEATRIAKGTHESIVDIRFNNMSVDGIGRFVSNIQASIGERIYLQNITIA